MPVAALVKPAFCSIPDSVATDGPDVCELAEMVGFGPDPEQELALDALFAVDARGRPAAFEFGVICSRQNLKTGLFKQAALGWLFLTRQRLVVWSAHEFRTAQEAFRDMTELIEGCEYTSRQLKHVHRASGNEAIELVTGQRLIFKARTKGGGRGLTGDKIVLDEAFALQPMHMGALLPTLSAVAEPQVVYGSSAGLVESDVLRSLRDRGRSGNDRSLAYLEWCAPDGGCLAADCKHELDVEGCALDSEDNWRAANPALGRRITLEHIRAERRALPPAEFARERLGWWDGPGEDTSALMQAWNRCADPDSEASDSPVFAIDVSPGSRSAAIVAATRRPDNVPHIEVVDYRMGTDWVVARCAGLDNQHDPLAWMIDPNSPAGALLPDLAERGIVPVEVNARQMGQACELLATTCGDTGLRHQGDPVVTAAFGGAARKDTGDGLWKWSRAKSANADICPLVAVTLAVWGYAVYAGEGLGPDDVNVRY